MASCARRADTYRTAGVDWVVQIGCRSPKRNVRYLCTTPRRRRDGVFVWCRSASIMAGCCCADSQAHQSVLGEFQTNLRARRETASEACRAPWTEGRRVGRRGGERWQEVAMPRGSEPAAFKRGNTAPQSSRRYNSNSSATYHHPLHITTYATIPDEGMCSSYV